MASNVNPVEAEIVSPGRANNKPRSGVDPEYAQRYAVGNDGHNDNQSFLQRHLFKLCFALGWLFFPFWWFASLWGLKKRRHLRERPRERAAWIASIVLSLAGLIIFLVLIIYYGADPERAKCKLAHRCKTESQVQQAQVQQAQEDPDTTLLTTLSVVYGGPCDDALHKELVDSIQGSLNGIPNSDGNLLAYKGPCTSASPGRHLLQDQSTYDVNVKVKNSANEATRQGLAQQLATMSTGGTNPPWCGEFCTNHQVQSTNAEPSGYKKCQEASYTCTSGTLIPDNVLMGNASASDGACCTSCTTDLCPAPAALRSSFNLASNQTPTFEVCCNACAKITCSLGAKSPPPPLSADTTPTEDLCCVLERSIAPTFSMDLPVTGECNAATANGLASGFASGLDPTQQGTLDVKAECVDTTGTSARPQAVMAGGSGVMAGGSGVMAGGSGVMAGGSGVRLTLTVKNAKTPDEMKEATKVMLTAVGVDASTIGPNTSVSDMVNKLTALKTANSDDAAAAVTHLAGKIQEAADSAGLNVSTSVEDIKSAMKAESVVANCAGLPAAPGVEFPDSCKRTPVGGTCSASCKAGVGFYTSTCGTDGTWQTATGSCASSGVTKKSCTDSPAPVTNAIWTACSGKEKCTATCASGYQGQPTAVCNPTIGTWATPVGDCTPVRCPAPNSDAATLWPTKCIINSVGYVCQAECNTAGGAIGTPPAANCSASGTWVYSNATQTKCYAPTTCGDFNSSICAATKDLVLHRQTPCFMPNTPKADNMCSAETCCGAALTCGTFEPMITCPKSESTRRLYASKSCGSAAGQDCDIATCCTAATTCKSAGYLTCSKGMMFKTDQECGADLNITCNQDNCCVDIPTCETFDCAAAGTANATYVNNTAKANESCTNGRCGVTQCCTEAVFSPKSTCSDPDSNARSPDEFECPEYRSPQNPNSSIAGKNLGNATEICCAPIPVFPVNATCLNTVGSGKPEEFQCSPMTDLKPRANVTSIAGQFVYKGQDLCCQSTCESFSCAAADEPAPIFMANPAKTKELCTDGHCTIWQCCSPTCATVTCGQGFKLYKDAASLACPGGACTRAACCTNKTCAGFAKCGTRLPLTNLGNQSCSSGAAGCTVEDCCQPQKYCTHGDCGTNLKLKTNPNPCNKACDEQQCCEPQTCADHTCSDKAMTRRVDASSFLCSAAHAEPGTSPGCNDQYCCSKACQSFACAASSNDSVIYAAHSATANDPCTNGQCSVEQCCMEVVYPASATCNDPGANQNTAPAFVCPEHRDPQNGASSIAGKNLGEATGICCKPVPACQSFACAASSNDSVIYAANSATANDPCTNGQCSVEQCCMEVVYPASATCNDPDANQNTAPAFVCPEHRDPQNGASSIAGKNLGEATGICCKPVPACQSFACAASSNDSVIYAANSATANDPCTNGQCSVEQCCMEVVYPASATCNDPDANQTTAPAFVCPEHRDPQNGASSIAGKNLGEATGICCKPVPACQSFACAASSNDSVIYAANSATANDPCTNGQCSVEQCCMEVVYPASATCNDPDANQTTAPAFVCPEHRDPQNGASSIAGKNLGEATGICCKPVPACQSFACAASSNDSVIYAANSATANDPCTNGQCSVEQCCMEVVYPASATCNDPDANQTTAPAFVCPEHRDPQNGASSIAGKNLGEATGICCKPVPACQSFACAASSNDSVIYAANSATANDPCTNGQCSVEQCCMEVVYPASATCNDPDANQNTAPAFVCPEHRDPQNGASSIAGKNLGEATGICCKPVPACQSFACAASSNDSVIYAANSATANDPCTNGQCSVEQCCMEVVYPASATCNDPDANQTTAPAFVCPEHRDPQNGASSIAGKNLGEATGICCKPVPACQSFACAASSNDSVIYAANSATANDPCTNGQCSVEQCCMEVVYPASATCNDPDANQNTAPAFVCPEHRDPQNGASSIAGKNLGEATGICCKPVPACQSFACAASSNDSVIYAANSATANDPCTNGQCSVEQCCMEVVYPASATCNDPDANQTTAPAFVCPEHRDPQNGASSIAGKNLGEATGICCKPVPACQSFACAASSNDSVIYTANSATANDPCTNGQCSVEQCCMETTCTAELCPAPATLRTSFNLSGSQAPVFELCCNACANITCSLSAKSPPPPLSADTTPTEDLCCVQPEA